MARAERKNPNGPSVEVLLGLQRHEGGNATRRYPEPTIAQIEDAAHWVDRLSITSDISFGKLDKVDTDLYDQRMLDTVKKIARMMSRSMSLQKYINSLPNIPRITEVVEEKPFLVEPRLSAGNLFGLAEASGPKDFEREQWLDKYMQETANDDPYFAWGKTIPFGQELGDDFRHASARELLFAKAQGVLAQSDPTFAQSTRFEGNAPAFLFPRVFGEAKLNFGSLPYSEKYNLVIKK